MNLATKHQAFGWGDAPSHSADYLVPVITDLVAKAGPTTVLNAGCGNGNLAAVLASRGYEVTGVDRDEPGIEIAKRLHPSAHFEVAHFDRDPPGRFDLVTSTEVIEHLYDPSELVQYCYRARNRGGTFIISMPYHGYLKDAAIALSGKWDHHHSVHHCCGHIKFFSRATLTELLERNGFQVQHFAGAGRLPYSLEEHDSGRDSRSRRPRVNIPLKEYIYALSAGPCPPRALSGTARGSGSCARGAFHPRPRQDRRNLRGGAPSLAIDSLAGAPVAADMTALEADELELSLEQYWRGVAYASTQ